MAVLRTLAGKRSVPALSAVLLLALTVAGLYLTSHLGSHAEATTSGPEMLLNIKGGDCDDPVRPTECDVALGAQFTLSVDALGVPGGGYSAITVFIYFGPLFTYLPTSTAEEEIIWPDCVDGLAGRVQSAFALVPDDEVIKHACLADPGMESTFVGNLVELAFRCPQFDSTGLMRLIPRGDPIADNTGTFFSDPAGGVTIPKTSDLLLNCGAGGPFVTPTPGPTNTSTPTPIQQPTPTFPPLKANDDFANAIPITQAPYKNKEDVRDATVELGEPTTCQGLTNSVWYSFTPSVDRLLVATIAESSFDAAVVAVHTGSTLSTLTEVACGGRLVFKAEAGVTYYLQLGACTIARSRPCSDERGSLQFTLEAGLFPRMALNVEEGQCDDPTAPTTCEILVGAKFDLNVDVLVAPFLGYILAQTYLDFGEYHPENIEDPDAIDDPETPLRVEGPGPCNDGIDNGGDEVPGGFWAYDRYDADCVTTGVIYKPSNRHLDEFNWPECRLAVRAHMGPGTAVHGCISGGVPPLTISHHEGKLLALSMTCSTEASTTELRLVPFGDPLALTAGAAFKTPQTDLVTPDLSNLIINCVDALPEAVGGIALDGELAPLGALDAGQQRGRDWGIWVAGAAVALVAVVVISAMVGRRLRSRS